MTDAIVLSIWPGYADAILLGIKRWEFRKSACGAPSLVYLYSISPIRRIVGEFDVGIIQHARPALIWKLTGEQQPGVSKDEFFAYFDCAWRDAFALEVKEARRYARSLDLRSSFYIDPPRSYTVVARLARSPPLLR